MLSYQHHYHVGNHADILKHWVLFECLSYMQKKDKPFDYIDTHGGAGIYRLNDSKTQKLKEFETGVTRLLAEPIAEMQDFVALLQGFVAQGQYPGSPGLVNELLRRGDKSWLFELHPQTFAELAQHCTRKRQTFVRQEDGFVGLNSLLPVASKRALVLIDPSYELKEDYEKVIETAEKARQKMPQTSLLIWYPVVDRLYVNLMLRKIQKSTLRNVLQLELCIAPDSDEKGMTGSGMILINPPWTMAEQARRLLPELTRVLAGDAGEFAVNSLIPE
ncbi:23S rRNA (adenine(2030)-N(6))-methyltransferase RlmJ [Planctobacterium marinum]|uniref:23S rRNA (adenine(2030)-N(6))-methyltransferase RlmJ n=1 Tax=Planctobacterium marinum TaxID=1631968 RepID=UPI001E42B067|nr:23S rRNA (adenine(2030)-N(6))-methyltransferase RlmJ [Planctobacterium marinum]MCC2605825.1 23S rRNA (adenine(2030)-N(6))-methyltransferase RlmJ [Planctobacterium marinum]